MKTIKDLEQYHEELEKEVEEGRMTPEEALKLQIEISDNVYNIVKKRNDKN